MYGSADMESYRIAYFTVDWNYELVESAQQGLRQYVDEHENVRLYTFDCFGKELNNDKDRSEYLIFDLPDLKQFDGVLIQANQIVLGSAREALARRIREQGIPALTIGCAIPGVTLVAIDNEAAQHDMAQHIIRDHGARRLAYLTGLMDNGCPEGPQRLDGFRRACCEEGVEEEQVEVFPCTWRTSDGARVARDWLRAGKPLPDAFICANDEMALGLMEVLEENHYSVPGDVLVCGFDNVSSAELSSPQLSTVNGNYAKLNYFAMQTLIELIDGAELPDFIAFPHRIIHSESCGCGEVTPLDHIRDRYFHQTRFLKNFYALQDQMAEELFAADDLAQLMETVEKHHGIFGCESMYLCINDYYFDNYEKKRWQHDSRVFGDSAVLAAWGDGSARSDARHQYARFPTRQLLPEAVLREKRFLVFYPLHYNTYCIGYLAMDGISDAAKLNLHESLFNFLEIAMENVRKKCLLRHLNVELDDLYVRDSLTGLYNRFGYKRFGERLFERFMVRDGSAQVLFIDMDSMKQINDGYGHENGDVAIRMTAGIIRSACDEQDFVMRYGGDEFLVIASGRAAGLRENIDRAIRSMNESRGLPFDISLSIGSVTANRQGGMSLEDCVQKADALMYEIKARKKIGR